MSFLNSFFSAIFFTNPANSDLFIFLLSVQQVTRNPANNFNFHATIGFFAVILRELIHNFYSIEHTYVFTKVSLSLYPL